MSEPRPTDPEARRSTKRIPFPLTEEMQALELKPYMRRGFTNSSMVQLTLVRFREFIREPEAVFWTFVFPILMAAGLGLAFRQRGPDKPHIGIIADSAGTFANFLKRDTTLVAEVYDDSTGAKALRTGKVAILVKSAAGKAVYIYD